MSGFEVPEPILNGPYDEPARHWRIVEGEPPRQEAGPRPATYYYRPPGPVSEGDGDALGTLIELKWVTRIRQRLAEWRAAGLPGVTRTTLELLELLDARGPAAPALLRPAGGRGDNHLPHRGARRLPAGHRPSP